MPIQQFKETNRLMRVLLTSLPNLSYQMTPYSMGMPSTMTTVKTTMPAHFSGLFSVRKWKKSGDVEFRVNMMTKLI